MRRRAARGPGDIAAWHPRCTAADQVRTGAPGPEGSAGARDREPPPGPPMLDTVFVLSAVAFFAVALAYVAGCDRL
ncbi:MAG TPA: hypothetical protein VLU43_14750 [Anaeromyxobacteraceae bacterium]|nr:hypothetical protein [Anaeromyxobacteraceae bacterium]